MKIGLVLDDTLDTPDGVQQYVLQVGKWLSSQGHDVHYLVGQTTRTDVPNIHSLSRNLKVKFNGNRMSMSLFASKRQLRGFLAQEQFDVLHVQVPYSPFLAGRLLAVAPVSVAVIGTFHILPNSKLVATANKFLAILNRGSGKRFDTMLAVSEPAKVFAQTTYGYQARVIPNPVNLNQFANTASSNTTTNIIFLGRLVARKGALQLLRAIIYLYEHQLTVEPFRVHIGGKGEQLGELQKLVAEHNLNEIVSFEGFIEEAAKADYLARADIAVYPSTGGESFGIVLLEAFAASRGIVLAGNNPGYASVMQPYPEQLFNPNDTRAFAEMLARYLDNRELRDAAMKAQREYVQQFDIGVVGTRLLDVYNQALQSRRNS